MRLRINVLVLSAVSLLFAGAAGRPEPLATAAVHAEPQYYLLALPTAPVSEIAAQVLGEALGLPFQIDEDVDAEMAFRAEGLFAPKALALQFGDQLRGVGVALVDRPSEGLWLIPTSELSEAISEGALPVTTAAPLTSVARPSRSPAVIERPVEVRPVAASIWSAWVGLLAVAAAGGWSVWLALASTRAQPKRTVLALPPIPVPPDDDLVVPYFEQIDTRP